MFFWGERKMFKKCTGCGHHWGSRESFLADHAVQLIGYQANFAELDTGYFMFNHLAPGCLTTFTIKTGHFRDFYHGEVYRERQAGSLKCPGHCQHEGDLHPCPVKCECGFVRDVMQVILKWPKNNAT